MESLTICKDILNMSNVLKYANRANIRITRMLEKQKSLFNITFQIYQFKISMVTKIVINNTYLRFRRKKVINANKYVPVTFIFDQQ